MAVHSHRQDRQELGLQQEVSTFKYLERVLTCHALSLFVPLLEVPPFISGMKLLHDGAIPKYPPASVSSVKKSASNLSVTSNQSCSSHNNTDLAVQYPEVS